MKPRRRSTAHRLADATLIAILLAALALGVLTLLRIRGHVQSVQAGLNHLEASLSSNPQDLIRLLGDPAQLEDVQTTLETLDSDLEALERLGRPVLLLGPHLGWLPGIGGELEAAPELLSMARSTLQAARLTLTGLVPLSQVLAQAETGLGGLGPELVDLLAEARPLFEAAQDSLDQASTARARLDNDRLSPRTQALAARFDRYEPLLHSALQGLIALPDLLGADGPNTYLVLAQNNHELRATGGFISGVGLVRIDKGQVTELRFQDSYAVDDLSQPHPPAPAPLRRLMGSSLLFLRDANWWPNFATSAKVAADLYRQDQGQDIDGVLAVDLASLRLLLEATGPLSIPGYEQPVGSDNLIETVMDYWQAPRLSAPGKDGSDWWQHRKDVAADLLAALVTHLMGSTPASDLPALATAMGQALEQRHVALYVKSRSSQALLEDLGWSGNQRPTEGDYLMVVDSNVGFNKVNPNIEQAIDHHVTLEPSGAGMSHLVLSYRHLVERPTPACRHESYYGDEYADLMERCYWDYVRVYLPHGSEVLNMQGGDEPYEVYEENGYTVVATSFLLANGQARCIELTYRPGFRASPGGYSLLVQKQGGTAAVPLRVTITPPEGSRPKQARPLAAVWLGDRLVWQGDLSVDRQIELAWK